MSEIIKAREFPHLVEISIFHDLSRRVDKYTYDVIVDWLNELNVDSDQAMFWAPWDTSPIIKQASHALIGFKNPDHVLVFKLTHPDLFVSYRVF